MEIDINNLPDGWRVEEGRKRSQKTGILFTGKIK